MAKKYSSWDKMMFSFTVPNSVRCKTRSIKNSKYTKLRELVKIKASLAKLLSRESDIKYFMNIELGEKYSNPHLHMQLYCKSTTSATKANLIRTKVIDKFNLNSNLCHITLPECNKDVYDYVIKDYSKFLSDDEVYNLDVQKKRYRSFLNKKIRFISRSGDRYTKRAYKIAYWSYNILREFADVFLDKLLNSFFYFNKKNLPLVRSFVYILGDLCKERTSYMYSGFLWIFNLIFFSPSNSPPLNLLLNLPKYDIIN